MQKLLTLKSECVIDLFFKQEKIKLSKTTARVFAFSDFNKDWSVYVVNLNKNKINDKSN